MDELISKQAAIDLWEKYHPTIAVDAMQYDAELRQLPPANCSEFPNNSDTISRQDALEAFGLSEKTRKYGGAHSGYATMMMYEIQDTIENLPPIQQKKGRWIKLDMHRGMADHKCSVCEQECYVPTCMGEPMYAFCPNCGAMMKGENSESN